MIPDFQKNELQTVANLTGRVEFRVFLEWLDRAKRDTERRLFTSSTDREQHFLISEMATIDSIVSKCRQARERAEGAATPRPSSDSL